MISPDYLGKIIAIKFDRSSVLHIALLYTELLAIGLGLGNTDFS